jgi:hypothetical protein
MVSELFFAVMGASYLFASKSNFLRLILMGKKIKDGCESKSTVTDFNGFYPYIFAIMLASSGEEQI